MNVRSLRTQGRRETFLDWISYLKYEILCIQETKLDKEFRFKVPNAKTVAAESGSKGGTAMILKPKVQILDEFKRKNLVRVRIKIGNTSVAIFTVYLAYRNQNNSHDDRQALYDMAGKALKNGDEVVVTGDFNDHYEHAEKRLTEIELRPILKGETSTREIKKIHQQSLIDNIFISPGLEAKNVSLRKYDFTDHKLISCNIGVKGSWK